MNSGVYILWFLGGSKIYIGSTKDFYMRKADHLSKMRRGEHNKKVMIYFNRFGEENCRIELLEEVESALDALKEREQYYLDNYCFAYDLNKFKQYSINICPRAYSLEYRKLDNETKEKMSRSMIGSGNNFFGKKHKQSSKDAMSKAKKGTYYPEHIRLKNESSIKGFDNHCSKNIYQLTESLEIVKLWASAREASENLVGVDYKLISMVCLGNTNRKRHAGFKWMFTKDYEKRLNSIN